MKMRRGLVIVCVCGGEMIGNELNILEGRILFFICVGLDIVLVRYGFRE